MKEQQIQDDFFEQYERLRQRNIPRLVMRYSKFLRMRVETFAMEHGFEDFNMVYMGFLANIGRNGATSSELARRMWVTKQAMSKILKEIAAKGYIEFRRSEKDRRSFTIFLTPKGLELLELSITLSARLKNEMQTVIGEEAVEKLIDSLSKLLAAAEKDEK